MTPPLTKTDVLVLGGGSAGYATALRAAQLGMKVTLVERDKLGGTCLHSGCIPTKALLHAAEVADSAREANTFGVNATFNGIDMTGVLTYQDSVVTRLHKGLEGLIKSRAIEVVRGDGRLVAERTIEVDGRQHHADHLVIATGSRSTTLRGLPLGGRVVGSDQALQLDHVPARVIVVGGGVIGCEFASVWRSFGAEVAIVEAQQRLVPTEDEASSQALERAFRKRGISIRTTTAFEKAENIEGGLRLHVSSGAPLEADLVLVAVGRGPNTAGIGLDGHGIALDRGFVIVDERLRTSANNTYAVGDVVAGLQLAHRGFAHGIFVADDIAGLNPIPVDDALIPRVTYSHPEVASVGLTETAARDAFGPEGIETVTYDLAGNGKSQILRTQGFVKLIRRTDGPIIGVHIVGARAGELISEAQLATAWEALPSDVARHLHAHPTQGEAVGEAFLALAGRALHAHG